MRDSGSWPLWFKVSERLRRVASLVQGQRETREVGLYGSRSVRDSGSWPLWFKVSERFKKLASMFQDDYIKIRWIRMASKIQGQ